MAASRCVTLAAAGRCQQHLSNLTRILPQLLQHPDTDIGQINQRHMNDESGSKVAHSTLCLRLGSDLSQTLAWELKMPWQPWFSSSKLKNLMPLTFETAITISCSNRNPPKYRFHDHFSQDHISHPALPFGAGVDSPVLTRLYYSNARGQATMATLTAELVPMISLSISHEMNDAVDEKENERDTWEPQEGLRIASSPVYVCERILFLFIQFSG